MTSLDNVIFIDSLPTLDIHGLDRAYANLKIKEFMADNIAMGNEVVVVVHGVGTGVLINQTKETLQSHKQVVDFKRFSRNAGCTIIQLQKQR